MTIPNDSEWWPKAACPVCEVIRYAPVDMTCDDCGSEMVLMILRGYDQ